MRNIIKQEGTENVESSNEYQFIIQKKKFWIVNEMKVALEYYMIYVQCMADNGPWNIAHLWH